MTYVLIVGQCFKEVSSGFYAYCGYELSEVYNCKLISAKSKDKKYNFDSDTTDSMAISIVIFVFYRFIVYLLKS